MTILDFPFRCHFQIAAGKLSATRLGSQRNTDTINKAIPALRH